MFVRVWVTGATTKVLKRRILIIGALLVVSLVGCVDPELEASKARAAKVAERLQAEDDKCSAIIAKAKDEYQRQFEAKNYSEAAATIEAVVTVGGCSNDKTLQSMIADAEVQHYKKLFADKSASAREKLVALDLFSKHYPEDAKPFENLRPAFSKQAERDARAVDLAAAKAKAAEAKAEASRLKKEGVRIGMSPEEVIASSWGKPQSVNRTTGKWGTHEQWVYGGRNYLYFENGTLSSIQN